MRARPRSGALRLAAITAVALALFLPQSARAQDLRLDDLFSVPEETEQVPPEQAEPEEQAPSIPLPIPRTGDEFDPAAMDSYLEALSQVAGEEEWDDLLHATEMLLAWIDGDDPGFDEVLWYRARAFDGQEKREELLELARLYLGSFPDGDRRGWFLLRAAQSAAERGNHADAHQLWRAMAEEGATLSPEEAAEGARLMLRRGDPLAARLLTASHAEAQEPGGEAWHEAVELFLESLLIMDDPEMALVGEQVPLTEDSVRLHVRRAALLAVRGEQAEAEDLAGTLLAGWTRRMVAPERELCERIVRGPAGEYWPPNRSAPREQDPAEDDSRGQSTAPGEGIPRQ